MKLKTTISIILTAILAGSLSLPASNGDVFDKGIEAFNAGEWNTAASRFQLAATQAPHDEVVRLTAGVALANVKRYSDAIRQFRSAAQLAPEGILPQLLLDGAYTQIGDAGSARQAHNNSSMMLDSGRAFGGSQSSDRVLSASLVRYPTNSIAVCLLGDSYQLQGKLDEAKKEYAKASSLAPKWAKPIFNLGLANLDSDPKSAAESFNRAIAMDPSNSRAYLWLGDAYLKQKQFDKAVEAYSTVQNDKALRAEALTRIGNAQMQAGNYAEANRQFIVAQQDAPSDPRPVAGQAQVFQNTGDLSQAESKYNQAGTMLEKQKAAPGSQAVVKEQIAAVQSAQGRYHDATSNSAAAFDLKPTLSNAALVAQTQQQAKLLDSGIAQNESALQKNPKDIRAMLYLLAAYKTRGDNTRRLDMAVQLTKADPTNAPTYLIEAAFAHANMGEIQKSLDNFVSAFDASVPTAWPNIASAARQCGVLNALTNRCAASYAKTSNVRTGKILFELQSAIPDAAGMISTAENLIKSSSEDLSLWLRLGEAYERAGQKANAITVYTKIASDPDMAAASAARARLNALQGGK